MGNITRSATRLPDYTSVWPNTKAPWHAAEAQRLLEWQFGKCHEVPVGRPAGRAFPHGDRGGGFEYFYWLYR